METPRLNITLSMILDAKRDELQRSKTFAREIERKYTSQVKLEEEFLAQTVWVCPPSVDQAVLEKNFSLELSTMDRNNGEYVILDNSSLKDLACVAQSINMFEGVSSRTGYNFLKKLITDVRLIGKPSAYGYAMQATLADKYKNMVVIKAPRFNSDFTNAAMNHEAAVGRVLNSLRASIPNFAYVYGMFECGPPIIRPEISGEKSKLITWCRSGSQVKYIMYENIAGSITLYDYVKTCTAQEYIDIILQIIHALMIAYNKTGFTHYDLHGENILVRSVPNRDDGFYIPYNGDFVFATKLATIIDYGMAHVYLPGIKESIGYKHEEGYRSNLEFFTDGIYIDQPHPLNDCYKIVSATLMNLYIKNPNVYDKVKGLLYYFHPREEDLTKIITSKEHPERIPYFGSKEFREKVSSFRYKDFITYCRDFCRDNDLKDPVVSGRYYEDDMDPSIIFTPNSKITFSPGESLNFKESIETIDELFDIIEPILVYNDNLKNEVGNIASEKLKNYNKLLRKVFDTIIQERNVIGNMVDQEALNLKDLLNNLQRVNYTSIPGGDTSLLRNSKPMLDYMTMVETTVQYLDLMDSIEKKIEMMDFITENILRDTFDSLEDLRQTFKDHDERSVILRFIKKDIQTLDDYINSRTRRLDSRDKIIESFADSMVSILPIGF